MVSSLVSANADPFCMGKSSPRELTQASHDSGCDPSQTIIIFDWDDTLCPSSWITANRPRLSYFRPPPNEPRFIKPLDRLQDVVARLLELAMSLGKVIIITNAKESWVTMSCTNFLPQLLPLVSSIPHIYARDTWSAWQAEAQKKRGQSNGNLRKCSVGMKSPSGGDNVDRLSQVGGKLFPQPDRAREDPSLLWKTLAFGVELTEFYSAYPEQSWSNVISIGDAHYERLATKNVVNCCSPTSKKKRAKTIKMFDDPTVEKLILQLEKIVTLLPKVVQHGDDVDIEIKPHDLIRKKV